MTCSLQSTRRRVLFLCTGNSARSQMAEWLVNHHLHDTWEAKSAGVTPAGFVHPLTLRVMSEVGIEIAAVRSKSVEEFKGVAFDLVVTVCDDAAEQCPVWLGGGSVVHVAFPDPTRAPGGPDERLEVFRGVRDAITVRLLPLITRWDEKHPDTTEEAFHVPTA